MTLLEKARELGVPIVNGAGVGCPCEHGLESESESDAFCGGHTCAECYAREYKGAIEHQRHFSTGAVRDDATGKGRYDLPWIETELDPNFKREIEEI